MRVRVAAVTLAVILAWPGAASAQIRVTLLGTGAPPPVMQRFGPAILVEAGGQRLLFDAGRGVLQRIAQTGVPTGDVRRVFLTHLHSDHVVGLPDLWLTTWITAGPEVPLSIWGPVGTKDMMAHLERAFAFDIAIRLADDAPPQGVVVKATDIGPGVIYDEGGVRVTAIEVDHRPVEPAFGYRIDFGGRSVVLSGDTRVSEELIRAGRGADLLIHEVVVPATLARAGHPPDRAQRIIDYHVTPRQAGEVFTRMAPRLAVYSHIVLPSAAAGDVIPATRETWAGRVELGEDLMVIEVGEEVVVRRPVRAGGS